MTSSNILNVGYLGNGKSTNRYHMPFVLARPNQWKIKTVMARHINHEKWAAVEGVNYTTNIDDVLGDPGIDLVEVTTPSDTHYEMAKRVIEAGKNCTVDKPFCMTANQARELFALAAEKGVALLCYQNRRWDSDLLTAKMVAESDKLGRVFEVVTNYDYFRPVINGVAPFDLINGGIYGIGCHALDKLIAWFGVPDRWEGDCRQLCGEGKMDDYCDFDLYYDELGLKASAHSNFSTTIARPSIEVYGTNGTFVRKDPDQQERDLKKFYLPADHDDFGLDDPSQWGTLRYFDEDGMHDEQVETVRCSYAEFYDALYDALVNGGELPVKPEETIAQIDILEQGTKNLK